MRRLLTTTAFLALFLPLAARGQEGSPGSRANPYPVPRAGGPIRLDGVLDEAAWESARAIELDWEVSPRRNVPPPVRTVVLLTYDLEHLYIGFRCFDPDPTQIRAYLRERDSLGWDDWVAVEIDTYDDSRRAFTLFSTPAGVQVDGISDAAGVKDYTWDMIYGSAGQIEDWGYSVEMAIPFSSLRFQRTEGKQVWGLNAVRGYPREASHQIWAQPYDRSNACRVCQYLRIEGFEGVTPGRHLEVAPTVTATSQAERDPFPDGSLEVGKTELDAGVTARWGITPNLVFSGTYNPDFSQVEADSPQLAVNQPFALFFPERRPFFTDGLDFFDLPVDLVHTRTMRDPRWGLKLTGKEGAHAIGAYVVQDEVTNLLFPGSERSSATSLDRESTSSVLRYALDIWNQSNLGVAMTHREGGDYRNTSYGLDGTLRFTASDELVFQLLGSSTRYDDEIAQAHGQPHGTFRDTTLLARYAHTTDRHRLELGYLEVGKGFRADLGFLPRVGYRELSASSRYEWLPEGEAWWTRSRLTNAVRTTSEEDGDLLGRGWDNDLTLDLTRLSTVTIGNTLSRERFGGRDFDLASYRLSAGVAPSRTFSLDVYSSFGDRVDYVNVREGRGTSITPVLSWNLGKHLRLDVVHTWERMKSNGDSLYTANLSEVLAIYHFTSRAFLRAIAQYLKYDYNPSNYDIEVPRRSEDLLLQLLFSYELNPRTVFFLGYSDQRAGGDQHGLIETERTYFAKVGYAWVP